MYFKRAQKIIGFHVFGGPKAVKIESARGHPNDPVRGHPRRPQEPPRHPHGLPKYPEGLPRAPKGCPRALTDSKITSPMTPKGTKMTPSNRLSSPKCLNK